MKEYFLIEINFDMQLQCVNGETFQVEVGDNMQTLKQQKWLAANLQLSLRQDFSNGSNEQVNDSDQESMKDIETTLSLSLSSSSARQQHQSSTPTSRIRLFSFPLSISGP